MARKIEYKLNYYHYSESNPFDFLSELESFLETMLPDVDVEFVSVDSEYGVLKLSYEEDFEDGNYQ